MVLRWLGIGYCFGLYIEEESIVVRACDVVEACHATEFYSFQKVVCAEIVIYSV